MIVLFNILINATSLVLNQTSYDFLYDVLTSHKNKELLRYNIFNDNCINNGEEYKIKEEKSYNKFILVKSDNNFLSHINKQDLNEILSLYLGKDISILSDIISSLKGETIQEYEANMSFLSKNEIKTYKDNIKNDFNIKFDRFFSEFINVHDSISLLIGKAYIKKLKWYYNKHFPESIEIIYKGKYYNGYKVNNELYIFNFNRKCNRIDISNTEIISKALIKYELLMNKELLGDEEQAVEYIKSKIFNLLQNEVELYNHSNEYIYNSLIHDILNIQYIDWTNLFIKSLDRILNNNNLNDVILINIINKSFLLHFKNEYEKLAEKLFFLKNFLEIKNGQMNKLIDHVKNRNYRDSKIFNSNSLNKKILSIMNFKHVINKDNEQLFIYLNENEKLKLRNNLYKISDLLDSIWYAFYDILYNKISPTKKYNLKNKLGDNLEYYYNLIVRASTK